MFTLCSQEKVQEPMELVAVDVDSQFLRDAPETNENISVVTKRKYRVPFPVEYVNTKEIPKDINRFLTKMYPNMLHVARDRLRKRGSWLEAEDLVQDFVSYFLSLGEKGIPRWGEYDAISYPDNTYLWWVLMHLDYFIRRIAGQDYMYRHCLVSYETYFGGEGEDTLGFETLDLEASVTCETESTTSKLSGDMYSLALLKQIESHLEMLGKTIPYSNRKFESQARNLFVSRLQGTTDAAIASSLGVSSTAVGLWYTKLKKVLACFLEEDQTNFDF